MSQVCPWYQTSATFTICSVILCPRSLIPVGRYEINNKEPDNSLLRLVLSCLQPHDPSL